MSTLNGRPSHRFSAPRLVPMALAILFLALVGTRSAHAQGKVAFGGASSAALTANAVCPPSGGVCSSTTTAAVGQRVPFAMTLSNLYAFQTTAPATASTCSFVVKVSPGGTGAYASTALSCSITPTSNKTCANTTSAVTVNPGDSIQVSFVEVGTCSGFINFGFQGTY